MASQQPSQPSQPDPSIEKSIKRADFQSFLHNASVVMLVAAPVLILIPPRKLDLYTFSLTGAFVASANHLTKERTGAGLLYQLPGARLPPAAQAHHDRMKAREEARRLLDDPSSRAQTTTIEEQLQKRNIEHRAPAGLEKVAKDLWMGGEKEGWKERRLAEEQKKLNEGEGYGGMIMDQIWEVWNWGEKKAEDLKEKDEKVVQAEKLEKRREEELSAARKKG